MMVDTWASGPTIYEVTGLFWTQTHRLSRSRSCRCEDFTFFHSSEVLLTNPMRIHHEITMTHGDDTILIESGTLEGVWAKVMGALCG
jgi:hypothetical protein